MQYILSSSDEKIEGTTSNSPAANMRGKPFRKRKHLCGRQRFKKNTAVGGRVQFFVLCGVQY